MMGQDLFYMSVEYGILTGLVSHAIYKNWEPTLPSFWRNYVLLVVSSAVLFRFGSGHGLTHIAFMTALFSIVHLAVLGMSITIYRMVLHPLNRFPGPPLAKLTKWTTTYYSKDGYSHLWLSALHEKYGPVVRTGPNELSFSSPSSVKAIHGVQGARLGRGPFYDAHTHNASGRGRSLVNTRDWENHRARRRVWDHGFAQKSLRSYEPRLLEVLGDLTEAFIEREGQEINLADWCDYFTFDVMGVLSFNKSFGLLKPYGPHDLPACIREGIKLNFLLSSVSWLSPFFQWIPISKTVKEQTRRSALLARQQYEQRRPQGTEPNDIFSHILAGNEKQQVTSEYELAADAALLFVGGSDPVTLVATFMFYFTLRDPKVHKRLQAEIDAQWNGVAPLEGPSLGHERYPFLNAIINETMRVVPPGPNGFQRFTNKGGHEVDGVWVPANTALSSNTAVLHHDPNSWTKPLEFIPERWLESERDPTWNHDTRAFVPFTIGTFSCVGKSLALLELRMLLATVTKKFDLIMAHDFDHKKVWSEHKSFMGTLKGDLPVTVRMRKC